MIHATSMLFHALREIRESYDAFENLKQCCGYVENGTSRAVTISQDDATKEWVVEFRQGDRTITKGDRSLELALSRAAKLAENV